MLRWEIDRVTSWLHSMMWLEWKSSSLVMCRHTLFWLFLPLDVVVACAMLFCLSVSFSLFLLLFAHFFSSLSLRLLHQFETCWLSFFFLFSLSFSSSFRIRTLRTSQIGKLISITGTVTRTSEVRPELLFGTFRCPECDSKIPDIAQQFKYTEVHREGGTRSALQTG